ncbi:MAG TPA: arginase family protein [Bacteroidales bacterium]|nr:arginase family protein [Bacteroidales bacterium]
MIDLNQYIDPVCLDKPGVEPLKGSSAFPHNMLVNTGNEPLGDLSGFAVAILGVPDDRSSVNTGAAQAPDAVRRSLYSFSRLPGRLKVTDLGNFRPGASFDDTIVGLRDVLLQLLSQNIVPVIIGGTSSLMPAVDRALSAGKQKWSMVSVDSRIDFTAEKRPPDSLNWMNDLIYRSGSCLSHLSAIGHQTYLTDQQVVNRFNRRHYDMMRIGEVRSAVHETEPLFRDASAALFDIGSVRQSDAPGTFLPSANGFYGEEICLLARYAGLSDNLKIFSVTEVNPALDTRMQTSHLAAQLVWFFLEGFSQKQYEVSYLSDQTNSRFTRYHVTLSDLESEAIFIKSTITERWWMEIRNTRGEPQYLACSYEDYLMANRDQVPVRWSRGMLRHGH